MRHKYISICVYTYGLLQETRSLDEGFVIGIEWADNYIVLSTNKKDYEHINGVQKFWVGVLGRWAGPSTSLRASGARRTVLYRQHP